MIKPQASLTPPAGLVPAQGTRSRGSPRKKGKKKKVAKESVRGVQVEEVIEKSHRIGSPVIGTRRDTATRDQGLVVALAVGDIMTITDEREDTLVSRHTIAVVDIKATHGLQTTPGVRSPVTEVGTDSLLNKVVFYVHTLIILALRG